MKPISDKIFRFAVVLAILIMIGVSAFLLSELIQGKGEDVALNLSAELLGIVIGLLLSAVIFDRIAQNKVEREQFQSLIIDMGGGINDFANRAVLILAHHPRRYLYNGQLSGMKFIKANLQGARLWNACLEGVAFDSAQLQNANMSDAHLSGTSFDEAHLENADLNAADLRGAIFSVAYLSGANLGLADLRGASFTDAHLESANLSFAHLEGALLEGAYLEGAILDGAFFDSKTWLPDGKLWTESTDLKKFTDRRHPEFYAKKSHTIRHSN